MDNNFDKVREENRLLFEYIRGSSCYELTTPESDVDTGGIYIAEPDEVLGLIGYKPQISDHKHDNTWYEIGNFIQLLLKSNPTVMEALFVPDNKIIGQVHPLFKELRDNRQAFLSKDIYWPFYGYARSQIEKARGLKKKIVNPVNERLGVLDFTYTFYKQGSTKIKNWLEFRGLKQNYCGLNNIPNMHDVYGLYYDFGNHVLHEDNWKEDKAFLNFVITLTTEYTYDNINTVEPIEYGYAIEWLNKQIPYGYSGLIGTPIKASTGDLLFVNESDNGAITLSKESTELRLSSINDKNDKPIVWIQYNKDGFTKHCKDYKEYKEWEKNRNPVRYESNLDKNYDSKNMMHCFRLIHMCKEILRDHSFNLVRTWDHDFLMDIRNHKYEYDELISMLEKETAEMDEIYKKSTLPEHIDTDTVNSILINIRKKQLGID